MPHFSHFGALLGLAALLPATVVAQTSGRTPAEMAVPANAQTRSDSAAAKVAHVEQVSVHAGNAADAGLTVEIQTSGARVAPNTQVITHPDRIIVDFPGALPAAALHALKVNQGALTRVRTGLFFNNPPITRVVLDLAEPQSYQISTTGSGFVVKLSAAKVNSAKADASAPNLSAPNPGSSSPSAQNSGAPNSGAINPVNSNADKASSAKSGTVKSNAVKANPVKANPATLTSVKSNAASTAKLNSATLSLDLGAGVVIERYPIAPGTRTFAAAPVPAAVVAPALKPSGVSPVASVGPVGTNIATVSVPTVGIPTVNVPPAISDAAAAPPLDPVAEDGAPPKPAMSVTFANGMLSIRTEKATLAQVLYEVQRQTQAEIAIPAGAEQEEVAANLGPAAARDVLASLLNGSGYNFIFIGSQERLERVILTVRDPNIF